MFCLTLFILFIPLIFGSLCPNESYEWQTKCYFFVNQSTGFPEAEVNCNSLRGHLASIHDGFTDALLTEKARDYFQQSSTENFWIGLSNVITLNNLTWIDGTDLDFIEWDSGQPGNIAENNCGAINLNNGRWLIDDCFKQKPYVCGVSKYYYENVTTPFTSQVSTTTTSVPTTITISPSMNKNCSGNFTYINQTNSYYGYFNHIVKSWSFAENFCQSCNGHLFSVHSQVEIELLMNITNGYSTSLLPWVGLSTKDEGKTWQWTDGSSWDGNLWEYGFGYPPNSIGFCTYLNVNGVVNYNCSSYAGTLCQIKLEN